MVRHGRVVYPMEDAVFTKVWQTYRGSQILSKGLLEEAQVMSSKDFVQIEDCSEEALPATTSLTHVANAAEKSVQLGPDAMHSLLRGTVGALGGKPTVLVVDLFPHTGDLCKAVVREKFKPSMAMNLVYLAFHESEIEAGPTSKKANNH